MKNTKSNKKSLLLIGIITLMLIFGFTLIQSSLQQEKQLIIGTWILDDDSSNKWFFTNPVLNKF